MFKLENFLQVYDVVTLEVPSHDVFRFVRRPRLEVYSLKGVIALVLDLITALDDVLRVVVLVLVKWERPQTLILVLVLIKFVLRFKLCAEAVLVKRLCKTRVPLFIEATDYPLGVIVDLDVFFSLSADFVKRRTLKSFNDFSSA